MSEEAKILAFVSFCIECYKIAKGVDGGVAAKLFSSLKVDEYLHDEYEVLHTMGEREILDDIDHFIAVRRAVA